MDELNTDKNKWQDAFEGSSMQPSEGLWNKIDTELTRIDNVKYRRRFIFYRGVAAAAMLIIFSLGFYIVNEQLLNSEIPVSDNEIKNEEAIPPEVEAFKPETVIEPQLSQNQPEMRQVDHTSPVAGEVVAQPEKAAFATFDEEKRNPLKQEEPVLAALSQQPLQVNRWGVNAPELFIASFEQPQTAPAAPAWYEVPEETREKADDSRLFAGFDVNTARFDPNFSSTASPVITQNPGLSDVPPIPEANLGVLVNNQFNEIGGVNEPRVSLSYGVNFGVQFSEKWIVRSGLNVSRFTTQTQALALVQNTADGGTRSIPLTVANSVRTEEYSAYNLAEATEVESNYDFISIPVTIAYQLMASNLSFSLGTGVAANLFMGNEIVDPAGDLNRVRTGNGSRSAFNSYYSALLQAGIGYRFLDNYQFSIQPNYALPLSSFTRNSSEVAFNSRPQLFGLNFGFRYLF